MEEEGISGRKQEKRRKQKHLEEEELPGGSRNE